ncbi:hypothetical protein SK128_002751 [Halocaridina rubra]|uniref:Uncharacterized protein n=1 Tax=Halocaridina rubra TaxID=373956 RepID=A0AAN8WUN7_HALRR
MLIHFDVISFRIVPPHVLSASTLRKNIFNDIIHQQHTVIKYLLVSWPKHGLIFLMKFSGLEVIRIRPTRVNNGSDRELDGSRFSDNWRHLLATGECPRGTREYFCGRDSSVGTSR